MVGVIFWVMIQACCHADLSTVWISCWPIRLLGRNYLLYNVYFYMFTLLTLLMFTYRIDKERDHNKVPAALSVPSLHLLFYRCCVLCPLCWAGPPAENTKLLHPPVLWQGKTFVYTWDDDDDDNECLLKATTCLRRKIINISYVVNEFSNLAQSAKRSWKYLVELHSRLYACQNPHAPSI